ncbi:MAG: beta-galactosidase [Anaerolineaceae bacterium]|nr:beta-galactosidase [Anaerolineaceae bacterium]
MQKKSFDLGWTFNESSFWESMLMGEAVGQVVNLPHDAMIAKPRAASNPSGTHGGFFPGSNANYTKSFDVPEEWRGQKVQLEFEGVYMNAEISVNKQLIQRQPYGYSSFLVDITPYLRYGETNDINVVANNTAQPNSRWYSGTGIYRHVWLRIGDTMHIKPWGIFVTTPLADTAKSVVQVATEIESLSGFVLEGAALRSTIVDADENAVAHVETLLASLSVAQTLQVTDAKLWSVDEPYLYTLLTEIVVDGSVVDSEQTRFGIRSIEIDAENGFRLNGVPMKLKGGCVHHDNGPLGSASYDRAEYRKVELLKSAGFNALRTAHNPPAPALLDACDELGMLVIDETFDCWRMGKTPNDYHYHFEEWWQRDTAAMVKRDRNHPSVIIWSIGNEILESLSVPDGDKWSQRQADYIRSLDSTRYTNSAIPVNFWEMSESPDLDSLFNPPTVPEDYEQDTWAQITRDYCKHLDVVGYNYLINRYEIDASRFPGRVIAGTETFPHQAFDYWMETERLPHVIGDFVWTAFDYIGEAGIGGVNYDEPLTFSNPYPYHLANCGDFDICGFKRPQSYYRDLLWGVRTAPFIAVLDPADYGKEMNFTAWGWEPVLASWTFPEAEGKTTQVDVYSIDDEVELFINGASVGRQPAGAANKNKASFEVTYQPGTIEAVGYTNGTETGRAQLSTAGKPAALRISSDRDQLAATHGDLAYITIEIVDENGVVVSAGEPTVSVEVEGAGDLAVLATANPVSEESYVGNERKAHNGRLLAIVRTSGEPGQITLTAQTKSLPETSIQLQVN